MRNKYLIAVVFAGMLFSIGIPERAAGEPFIGEIRWFAGNFAPRGWAFCDGQLLAISENDALFSLIGTIYGGDGQTTFALPDMRGRIPVHEGSGPGLSTRMLGQKAGAETHTLTANQIPGHTHTAYGDTLEGDSTGPEGKTWAKTGRGDADYAVYDDAAKAAMHPGIIGSGGGGQPHSIMMPFQGIHCIIALNGIYPSQN